MVDGGVLHVPHEPSLLRRKSCRRLSYAYESLDQIKEDSFSPIEVAVIAAGVPPNSRRASLNCNVEYALAMVNENPSLDNDDRLTNPFGCRRDSMCGNTTGRISRRNIKKTYKVDGEDANGKEQKNLTSRAEICRDDASQHAESSQSSMKPNFQILPSSSMHAEQRNETTELSTEEKPDLNFRVQFKGTRAQRSFAGRSA